MKTTRLLRNYAPAFAFLSIVSLNQKVVQPVSTDLLPNLEITDQPQNEIEVYNENTLNIWPNPVHNKLTISGTEIKNQTLSVSSASGNIMIYTTFSQQIMDVSRLPEGVYFLSLDQQVAKFIKI